MKQLRRDSVSRSYRHLEIAVPVFRAAMIVIIGESVLKREVPSSAGSGEPEGRDEAAGHDGGDQVDGAVPAPVHEIDGGSAFDGYSPLGHRVYAG